MSVRSQRKVNYKGNDLSVRNPVLIKTKKDFLAEYRCSLVPHSSQKFGFDLTQYVWGNGQDAVVVILLACFCRAYRPGLWAVEAIVVSLAENGEVEYQSRR